MYELYERERVFVRHAIVEVYVIGYSSVGLRIIPLRPNALAVTCVRYV